MSVSHKGLLLLKTATVNRNLGFDDVCKEKHVFVAYNNEYDLFEVSNITGEMVKYPVEPVVSYNNMAWEWEIQAAFFKYNNITPQWFNCNYTWGTLNETTDQATGAVGLIHRDEADYAIWGFAGTYHRSKVAAFSPGIVYAPYHWLTRYPLELSPTWNLLGLFTKVLKSTNEISRKSQKIGLTIYLVCLDVDILLHVTCHCVTENMFKMPKGNISRDKINFN